MKDRGAVVWVRPDGTEENFSMIEYDLILPSKSILQNKELSINWKETYTAIRAIELTAADAPPLTHIRVGVDNTSAVSVINRGSIAWCHTLDSRLSKLRESLEHNKITFSAHYVPGKDQVADERSRGKTSTQAKGMAFLKCMECIIPSLWERIAKRSRPE
eukprot:GILI01012385.1.p1 GENE.GILI01012385.1~~GILI01012385.1.p1  ORF type:complete len:187 (-),score=0.34 GILI01012385.1:42-521(-)